MADSNSGIKVNNVVTSFTEKGYREYGKDFVDSFLEYWPKNVRLTVYYEGEGFDFKEGLSWRPIEEVVGLDTYMSNLRFPIMSGNVNGRYDINFDARMARKVFIQSHALDMYQGKVFWIDADVITHSKVPETFLDEMLPDDKFCCYLGRDGWYYTESGFLGFNAASPIKSKFMNAYKGVFESGVIFTQSGWHDCIGFDLIRNLAKDKTPFHDLAVNVPKGTMHPYVNSPLGAYMDHRKGPRKASRSTVKDLTTIRTEPYWNAK